MSELPVIVWFRRDLRVADNPALHAAHETGRPIIAVFILDEGTGRAPGKASQWWLHHALLSLSHDLQKSGLELTLRHGNSENILRSLIKETGANHIFWNRLYFQSDIERDKVIKSSLKEEDIFIESFNGNLIREPWEVKTGSGGYYRVYTPYWRQVKSIGPARQEVLEAPTSLNAPHKPPPTDRLEDWQLTPSSPNWAEGFDAHWQPGSAGAFKKLELFFCDAAHHYTEDRNRPDRMGTSRLSPHLAWGEISPVYIWHATLAEIQKGHLSEDEGNKFLSEIVWREFAYHLLYFYPDMANEPMKPAFSEFPWHNDPQALQAWQKGMTGYPVVDAGMRELWETGWMHNRVRMIVASFLIKHLLIPWQDGEKWFWDTLVDADIANNSASWQWVAGCGADAAPYFRIFNPFSQGEKFDPEGHYVRQYVPELINLPNKYIHQPWSAPQSVLDEAGVILGETYPKPIVDHALARKRALDGYETIKGKS